ncbi:MAG: UDP-3-O-(3-hydroxymyristoyl)glucosamine N-acyltransferase [Armatimonadetes bacterium]|nr:UDP-3-O-(3-hydroxymyristoyl)glucosamine N-acyltransferase [Armatimonadota bacterium]
MSMTLSEVCELVGGELRGDGALVVERLAALDQADEGSLVFAFDPAAVVQAEASGAGSAVVRTGCQCALPHIVVPDVRKAQSVLLRAFQPPRPAPTGVHPTAVLGEGVVVGSDPSIAPYAVIGAGTVLGARVVIGAHTVIGERCAVGDDTILKPHVTLYDGVRVGARCTIDSGAVVGADGYGFTHDGGQHQLVPQIGGVVIEDECEIGANTCIDRATLGCTRIGAGTKIDNLVMVAHNVRTGRHCLLISQVGVAGSTTLGNGVVLAGQVGVADHLDIGDGVMVGAQSGVAKSAAPGQRLMGTPALPGIEFHRMMAALTRLPDMMREARRAEREARAAAGQESGG